MRKWKSSVSRKYEWKGKIVIFVSAFLFLAGILLNQSRMEQGLKHTSEPAQSENTATDELEVHFIDVGQGDCTLILCGQDAMLIDAGDNEKGTKIQSYLQKQGVKDLKYVICTHPDADHIGGMDVILYKFSCETILMTEEEKDTDTYRDVIDVMKNKGYQKTQPVVGARYFLGEAEFTIVGPDCVDEDSNNNSIAIVLRHGENTFLFTGDAKEEEELAMIDTGISLAADVYKAGHHGSRTSSTKRLLEEAAPVYAVISCAEGNTYGHPHAETLNHLRELGVKVFRTDEQGSIVVTSDGRELTWNCSPSETWRAGEPTGSLADIRTITSAASQGKIPIPTEPSEASQIEASALPVESPMVSPEEPWLLPQPSAAISYICNTNTRVFHQPNCLSVEQMSEKNKLSVTITREEIIEQGYQPCKRCQP